MSSVNRRHPNEVKPEARAKLERSKFALKVRSALEVYTGALEVRASNPKRAHPPIPPHGRALTLRPRGEVEARALQVCAQGSRQLQPGNRYFLAENGRRGPREQRPIQTEFVSPVRSGFQGGHVARTVGPWANGRRRGVPDYDPAAPLAPGGDRGRWGPTPGSRTARSTMTKEVRDED